MLSKPVLIFLWVKPVILMQGLRIFKIACLFEQKCPSKIVYNGQNGLKRCKMVQNCNFSDRLVAS